MSGPLHARRRWSGSPIGRRAALALAALLPTAAACGGSSGGGHDAGRDLLPFDSPAASDGSPQGLAVDFTVMSCPNLEAAVPRCRGAAPLTLSFVPVTSPSVGTFLWDFGDKTARAFTPTPTHTFTLPGSYDITLTVAGSGGTQFRARMGFVVIEPAGTGGLCDLDAQCQAGRKCLCVPGTMGCPPAFARGLCTSECAGDCGSGMSCADLSRSIDGDAVAVAEPWRKKLCLRACEADDGCQAGLRCRLLPGVGAGWVKACFVPVPGSIGAACRGPSGKLSNAQCLTGSCEDLGALGVCTLDCKSEACPAGSGCALLGDGRTRCLRTCTSAAECGIDPLLSCELPGGGALGFSIVSGPPGRYCAPRRCSDSKECGPSGTCKPADDPHCERN